MPNFRYSITLRFSAPNSAEATRVMQTMKRLALPYAEGVRTEKEKLEEVTKDVLLETVWEGYEKDF